MCPDETNPARHRETRRQFIKTTGTAAAAVAGAGLLQLPLSAREDNLAVAIVLDPDDAILKQAPAQWAVEQLRDALAARGVTTQIYRSLDQAPPAQECVVVGRTMFNSAGAAMPGGPESLALQHKEIGKWSVLLASGADGRGLVYALLELADRRIRAPEDVTESLGLPLIGTLPKPIAKKLAGRREVSVMQRRVIGLSAPTQGT